MSSLESLETKASLRVFFKKQVDALTVDEQNQKSRLISALLKNELKNFKSDEIGVYAPIVHEVHWELEFEQDQVYLFSRFVGEDKMAFYPSRFSQLEKCQALNKVYLMPKVTEAKVPKVLLIPGLGFTKNGERLGRGKGYFDRYLEDYKGLKIGLCFKVQLTNVLPQETHDVKMDWVVSEDGIVKLGTK